MRHILSVLALLFAATAAFAQDANTQPPAAAPPAPADTAPAPVPQTVAPAPANPPMTGPRVLISTSLGDITLQLDSGRAPKSVANVLRYVKEKHYDNTAFYRVAKGFVIQMGSFDANGKGRGGLHPGPVPLEANNGLVNLRGTVAMARAEAPDSAMAEFFINLADNDALNHKADDAGNATGYAVFGEVVSGMDVVDAIGNVPVGDNGPMPGQAPVTPIIVKKVTLLK
jgi:cyclophilin family peptidyl-prolyl cis-trans isomerase